MAVQDQDISQEQVKMSDRIGNDEDLIKHIKNLYGHSHKALTPFHNRCKELHALYAGDDDTQLEPGRSRVWINEAFRSIEDVCTNVTANDPGWQVFPDQENDNIVRENAYKTQGQIKDWWKTQKNNTEVQKVVRDALKYSVGIAGYPWNDDLLEGRGDIDFFRCDVRGCYWDPEAEDISRGSRWFIREYNLSPEQILVMYGVEVKPIEIPDSKTDEVKPKSTDGKLSFTITQLPHDTISTPQTVQYDLSQRRPISLITGSARVLECWWRPMDMRKTPLSERQLKAKEENNHIIEKADVVEVRSSDDHATEIEIHQSALEQLNAEMAAIYKDEDEDVVLPPELQDVVARTLRTLKILDQHIGDHERRLKDDLEDGEEYNPWKLMYPKGRLTIIAPDDDKILYDGANKRSYFPYRHLNIVNSTNRIIDISMLSQVESIELERRRLSRSILDGIKLRMRPPKINPGGLMKKELVDAPGQIYNCDDRNDAPFAYIYPEAPVQDAMMFERQLTVREANILGNNLAMQGRSPEQPNPSGKLVENLQSAGMTRLGSLVRSLSEFLEGCGNDILEMMLANYTSARTFRLIGELPTWWDKERGDIVSDYVPSEFQQMRFKVHINATSMVSDEAKTDPSFILAMYQADLYDDQAALEKLDPEKAREILARKRAKEAQLAQMTQQLQAGEQQIDQQKEMMKAGGGK